MSTTPAYHYRLERPRSNLPPLQLQKPPTGTSPSHSPTFSFSEPVSPPPSARSLIPSSSSTSNHRRDRSSVYTAARARRATPPPSDASSKEMLRFATLCHTWLYDQDEQAGHSVTQIMQSVPDSLRAPYIKLQASIRSAYHASISSRRIAEFNAQLSSTYPGGSLSPSARSDPHGKVAITERRDRFAAFLRTWCNESMPGPKPFFEGLWGIMRLMTLPENIGGAGSKRIQWEIDDAVFRETAGKDFMFDAISTLKGILGFNDQPSIDTESGTPSMTDLLDTDALAQAPQMALQEITPPEGIRDSSDPFTDEIYHSSGSPSTKMTLPLLPSPAKSSPGGNLFSAMMLSGTSTPGFDKLDEPQLRVWLAPDLSNSEYTSLYSLFPSSITNRSLPRFSPPPQSPQTRRKEQDPEDGFGDEDGEHIAIRCGTGRMWISDHERTGVWKGGWWGRFVGWLKRLFC